MLVSYVAALLVLDVTPGRIFAGLGRLGDITLLMFPPSPGSWDHFWTYLGALGQTLAIAFLGTTAAGVLALPLGFLAARNVVAGRIVHFLSRRVLDTIRSVDTLIWALIWINVVGLGPFAGALAIASTDFAALAKLMSEAIETADRGPVEGVIAAGGGRLAVMRFGLLPQVLPVFASQALYFLRIEHTVGDHHRHRGSWRDRSLPVGDDPRAGVAGSSIPDRDGADHCRGDRRDLPPAARGDHGCAPRTIESRRRQLAVSPWLS